MQLYFSPLACSLASRIALYEAALEVRYIQVDTKARRTEDGRDYGAIHELGTVPALELDDARLITENAAILQFIARVRPEARLGAQTDDELIELQRWLSFIGTELHKSFQPLLSDAAGPDAKAYALAGTDSRLGWLARKLDGRDSLLGHFSVADAYLFTVLNWCAVTPVDLSRWPTLLAYHERLRARPAVARAFSEEGALYKRKLARRAADSTPSAA